MPSLWCILSVIHPSGRTWEEASFWYDLWLKRSQGQPLVLEIHCFLDESTQVQSLLHPYNTRISSLRLLLANTTIEPELLLQDLPTLQEFTLDWKGGCYRADIAECISRLPCTLRDLKFKGITINPSKNFSTAWAYLKNVEITVQQPHHVLHVLQLCHNLSSLEICVASDGHFPTEVIQPFTHTNIQSLSVSCSSWSTSDSLLDVCNALTLPNLRVLEVHYHVRLPHEELKAFLARSNYSLKRLIFCYGERITDQQRAEYVALIPSLEVLNRQTPESNWISR